MLLLDLLFALAIALLLTALFFPVGGYRRTENVGSAAWGLLFFFLVLFFTTWAGGVWMQPVGPPLWGAYWVPFLLVGVFIALLLTAATMPTRVQPPTVQPPSVDKQAKEAAMSEAFVTVFGIFFWVLIIGLLVTIVVRYVA